MTPLPPNAPIEHATHIKVKSKYTYQVGLTSNIFLPFKFLGKRDDDLLLVDIVDKGLLKAGCTITQSYYDFFTDIDPIGLTKEDIEAQVNF